MTEEGSTTIRISMVEPGSDSARRWLDDLSAAVSRELYLNSQWETPDKKGIDPSQIDWNTILISVFASSGLLIEIVRLIQARIAREQKLVIEIDGDRLEISGTKMDAKDQELLIKEWLKRQNKRKK